MDGEVGVEESIPDCCGLPEMTYTPSGYILSTLRGPQTSMAPRLSSKNICVQIDITFWPKKPMLYAREISLKNQ